LIHHIPLDRGDLEAWRFSKSAGVGATFSRRPARLAVSGRKSKAAPAASFDSARSPLQELLPPGLEGAVKLLEERKGWL